MARLSFSTPAALGVQISSASHGESRSNGPSIPATSASAQTQTTYSSFLQLKRQMLPIVEGKNEKSLRREAYVCDELPPRPRVCRYQLGRLRRLLIKTGAEEIS